MNSKIVVEDLLRGKNSGSIPLYDSPWGDTVKKWTTQGMPVDEAKAGNDIFKYAGLYGDKLCFIGGLDARVLETGDQSLIEKEITKLIQGMHERDARFVYGSDHSLSTNIDYKDFVYSLDVYRRLCQG